MPRKIVTNKSDIPSWYQRRITDFENLTENEALFEYEALKLTERARKQAKRLGIDYKPEKIERPDYVTEADIKYLQNIKASDVKQAIKSNAPLVPVDPFEPIEGESPEEYMERTGQIIDPETGGLIPIADFNDKTEQFIDEVIEYTKSYTAGRLEIADYSSKTGRRKSASNYQWQQDNILRAMNKILSRLEEIRTNPKSFRKFGELCGGSGDGSSSYLADLKSAIGAYIADSYHDDTGDSYYTSDAYNLLNFEPESMDDDWQPDYGEYGDYDPYAYEDDDY